MNVRLLVVLAVTATQVYMADHSVAFAQNVHDAPLGTTFQNVARIGPRQLPLPPGTWTLATREVGRSTGAATGEIPILRAYLVQYTNNRLDRWIWVSTNLQVSSGGWTRNRDICDRGDVLFNVSDQNYNSKETECWTVNHIGLTLPANAAEYVRQFFSQSTGKGRPNTGLAISFFLVEAVNFIHVSYLSNPDLAGFEPTPTAVWQGNPWHRDIASRDPKKMAYVDKLKAEGQQLLPLIKKGLNGRL